MLQQRLPNLHFPNPGQSAQTNLVGAATVQVVTYYSNTAYTQGKDVLNFDALLNRHPMTQTKSRT